MVGVTELERVVQSYIFPTFGTNSMIHTIHISLTYKKNLKQQQQITRKKNKKQKYQLDFMTIAYTIPTDTRYISTCCPI